MLEVHRLTGFADAFTHLSEPQARATDLSISLCAVLLAEACNIGLEAVVDPDTPALSAHRLAWVQHNYIRTETLAEANSWLVRVRKDRKNNWGRWDCFSIWSSIGIPIISIKPCPSYNAKTLS